MFIFLALLSLCCGKNILISFVVGGMIDHSGYKTYISNAYLRYIYAQYSTDTIEVRVNDNVVLAKTTINEKATILHAIETLNLSSVQPKICFDKYFLDNVPEDVHQLYLVTDTNICKEARGVVKRRADDLKSRRYVSIYPVGVGSRVDMKYLEQLAGPCDVICIKGLNYNYIS